MTLGPIFSEKYWHYYHCPKNVLRSILSFIFWIFPPLDTAVQLESAESKQNANSKSLFQDSFRLIFWAMRKMHHTFWEKATFKKFAIVSIALITTLCILSLHYLIFLFAWLIKFIYSEKATKFCKVSISLLTGTTEDKSKVDILQNFVVFSECMNLRKWSWFP